MWWRWGTRSLTLLMSPHTCILTVERFICMMHRAFQWHAHTYVYTEQKQNNTHINIKKTGTGDAACNMLWNIMHDQKGSFNTLQRFYMLCLFACNDQSHDATVNTALYCKMGLYYVQHVYVTCDLAQRQSNFKLFMKLWIVNIHNKYILKTTKDLCLCNGGSDKSHPRKQKIKAWK
jgi:hypothetical protein